MGRGEPTLAPEWLKSSGYSSSHSDEHSSGTLSRNRLAASACEHETPRASSLSFRRSASSNGSMGHDKDGYARSRDYSNFSRGRDRDRDRQSDRVKDKLLDNGFNEFCDSLMARRIEKETLRRSQSMVSGRRVETLPKRLENGSSNGVHSVGGLSGGGLSKVSFYRDFPSLGAEEKHGVSEVLRVPSPGINTAINNLHISTSAIVGADRWTSALAEVPAVGAGNGSSLSSALQSTANTSSTSLCTTAGLSMAETLAQAPSRARTALLLSDESERLKELTLMQQYNKLIPVTPQAPKNLVLSSVEKLKPKGARNGDLIAPKIGLQSSSQLAKTTNCQAGNFLVLNRERSNGASSPAAKDGPPPPPPLASSASRVQSASGPRMKLKANDGMMGEKKPLMVAHSANQKVKSNGGAAQDRNDFFNSLRKKAEMKNGVSHHHPELSCAASSSASSMSNSTVNLDGQIMEKNILSSSNYGLSECAVTENGAPDIVVLVPDEKERAFLESLGWNENYAGDEEALTAEEIESFLKKHKEKLGPDFKYRAGLIGSFSSGLSLSSS